MKFAVVLAQVLHVVIGIGASAGGYACISDPINPLGAPLSMLEGSPFSSYMIPGLVLGIFFGLGNLLQIFFVSKRVWYRSIGEGLLGGGMIVWIVVQLLIINTITPLHVLFFLLGAIQGVIGLVWLYKETLGYLRQQQIIE